MQGLELELEPMRGPGTVSFGLEKKPVPEQDAESVPAGRVPTPVTPARARAESCDVAVDYP